MPDDLFNLGLSVDSSEVRRAEKDLDNLDKAADRYTDSQGRLREANGKFAKSLGDANQAAGRYRDTQGRLREANGRFAQTQDQTSQSSKKFSQRTKDSTKAMEQNQRAASGLTGTFKSLRNIFAVVGGFKVASDFIRTSESFVQFNTRIRLTTDTLKEFQSTQRGLLDVANDTRTPIAAIGELYQRVTPSLQSIGKEQAEILGTIDTINKAIIVGGGNAQQNTAAVIQFAQALGSGVLQGDELRSILENAPALAQQLAQGLNVPVSQLRQLGAQGQLTTEVILKALENQRGEIDRLFREVPVSSGQAWTLVQNQATVAIDKINERFSITSRWSNLLVGFSGFIADAIDPALMKVDDLAGKWERFTEFAQQSDALPFELLRTFNEQLQMTLGSLIELSPYMDEFAIGLIAIAATRAGLLGVGGLLAGIVGGAAKAFASLKSIGVLRLSARAIGLTAIGRAVNVASVAIVGLASQWERFTGFWNDIELEQKELGIDASGLDFGQRAALLFRKFWEELDLRDRAVNVVVSVIDFTKETFEQVFRSSEEQAKGISEQYSQLENDSRTKLERVQGFFKQYITDPLSKTPDFIRGVSGSIGDAAEDVAKGLDQRELIREIGLDQWGEYASTLNDQRDEFAAVAKAAGESLAMGLRETTPITEQAAIETGEKAVIALGGAVDKNKFYAIGVDAAKSFASGLTSQQAEVINSANDLADTGGGSEAFQKALKALNTQTLELVEGEDAARNYALAYKDLTQAEINQLIAVENVNTALKDHNDLLEKREEDQRKVLESLGDLSNRQQLHNIALTQGATAAKIAAFEMEGFTLEQAKNAAAIENTIDQQEALQSTISSAISNANSIKDVFDNLADYMSQWLKDRIAEFAANKIVVSIVGNLSGIGDILGGNIGSLFGSGAAVTGSSGTAGGLGAASVNAGQSVAGGGLLSAGNVSSSFGGIGSGSGAAAGLAQAGAAFGAGVLGYMAADALGGNGTTAAIGAAIGFAVAGPVGAVVGTALGGAFGTRSKKTGEGFNVGFSGGDVFGDSFDVFTGRRSLFRGTKTSDRNSRELNILVEREMQLFFNALENSVTMNADALGIVGADAILDSFQVASKRIAGSNAEEDLAEFLEETTRDAYQVAFDNLAPEIQSIIESRIGSDLDREDFSGNSVLSVDLIESTFSEVGFIADTLSTQMQGLGITLETSFEQAAVSANRFVEAAGSLDEASRLLASYQNLVGTQGIEALQIQQAQDDILVFNRILLRFGDAAISNSDDLQAYIDGLDRTSDTYDRDLVAALQLADAIGIVTDAREGELNRLSAVNDLMSNLSLVNASQEAADSLVNLLGGIEEFTQQTNSFIDNFYSAEDQDNFRLANATRDVADFNSNLGLTGENRIDTNAEATALFEKLLADQANGVEGADQQLQDLLNIQDSLSIITNETNGLDDAISRLPDGFGGLSDVMTTASASATTLRATIGDVATGFDAITAANSRTFEASPVASIVPVLTANDGESSEQTRLLREAVQSLVAVVDAGNQVSVDQLNDLLDAISDQTDEVKSNNNDQALLIREIASAVERSAA